MATDPLKVRIAGLGCYLPERRVTSAELEENWNIPAGWIERVTGVRERRYVGGETSASMGAAAARQALEEAGLAASDLDLIMGASTSPQQAIPCTAVFVQRELGIAETGCPCFDVNATCLSFMVALDLAARLIDAGAYRRILIFSSEASSRFLDPNGRESAVLFGDAAAAAVITRSGPGEESTIYPARIRTDSRGADLTEIKGGGSLHPPNDPMTTPLMNTFSMNGPAVLKMASRAIKPFLDEFFRQLCWTRESIDVVTPHQASLLALRQLTHSLGFRSEQIFINLPTRGNCIAASLPLALTEAVYSGRLTRGQRVLLLGTGAGLSMGAMALRY